MAGRLRGFSSVSGSVFLAFDANNHVWNGSAFEAWNNSNIALYAIAATQLGTSGWWSGNEPAGAVYFILNAGPAAVPLTVSDKGTLALPDAAPGTASGLWVSDGSNNRLIDTCSTVSGNVNGHVGSVSGNVNGNVNGNVVGNVDSVANVGNIATSVWQVLTSSLSAAGSVGLALAQWLSTLGSDHKVTVSSDAGANPSGSLTITPIQASVSNPRYATRDLPPIAQNSTPTDFWIITDGAGNAIDLSAKTVRLVGYKSAQPSEDCDPFDAVLTALWKYETGGAGITVTGTSNNQVNVAQTTLSTATVGHFYYILWNVTDGVPLAKGKYPVEPAVLTV